MPFDRLRASGGVRLGGSWLGPLAQFHVDRLACAHTVQQAVEIFRQRLYPRVGAHAVEAAEMGEQQPVADAPPRADDLAMIPDLLLHPGHGVIGQQRLRLPARDHHGRIPGAPEGSAGAARAIDALVRDLHPPRGGAHAAADRQRFEKGDAQIERELRLRGARLVAGQILDQRGEAGWRRRCGGRGIGRCPGGRGQFDRGRRGFCAWLGRSALPFPPLAQRRADAGARFGGVFRWGSGWRLGGFGTRFGAPGGLGLRQLGGGDETTLTGGHEGHGFTLRKWKGTGPAIEIIACRTAPFARAAARLAA